MSVVCAGVAEGEAASDFGMENVVGGVFARGEFLRNKRLSIVYVIFVPFERPSSQRLSVSVWVSLARGVALPSGRAEGERERGKKKGCGPPGVVPKMVPPGVELSVLGSRNSPSLPGMAIPLGNLGSIVLLAAS